MVVVAALGFACAAPASEDIPPVVPEGVDLDGKADGASDEVRRQGRRLFLYGDLADELYDILTDAGLTGLGRGSLSYRYGRYVACVTNGRASACELATRSTDGADGFAATIHGARFRSAASELFGALAVASGVLPASVGVVESGRFVCEKSAYSVWCGFGTATAAGLELVFDGLEPLGPDYVYEGWIITGDGPVTSGRFDAPDPGETLTFEIGDELRASATTFVLTIEPRFGDDPAPASTHMLAGRFEDGAAALTVDHPAALGTDFSAAAGGFILETPSTGGVADDYDQGVWFLDPSAGPGPSLELPELPEGWTYEGWVVTGDGPLSTGRFRSASNADDDGAGPTAGPDGSPPFPGQDFIAPPLSLIGLPVVVSVEPMPDDSPAPFAIKPLVGTAADAGRGGFQSLGNTGRDTLPTGSALLRD
jgi:hypothetical protein